MKTKNIVVGIKINVETWLKLKYLTSSGLIRQILVILSWSQYLILKMIDLDQSQLSITVMWLGSDQSQLRREDVLMIDLNLEMPHIQMTAVMGANETDLDPVLNIWRQAPTIYNLRERWRGCLVVTLHQRQECKVKRIFFSNRGHFIDH